MKIIKPSAPMRSEPDKFSELETECLFGESIEVLDKNLEWYYCRLLTDNYCGWVQKKNTGKMISPSHRVIANRTYMFKEDNIKSVCINYLPLGAQVHVKDINKKWAKIVLFDKFHLEFAYIPSNHIIEINNRVNNWVGIAEKLIGTPYIWGGRNSIGLDCSALLQLSYQTYGENIPRNSVDQCLLKKEIVNNHEKLKRGFVVFWNGHVGIMVDELNCIHANAFHMEVSKELLADIIERSSKEDPVIKIMNFN